MTIWSGQTTATINGNINFLSPVSFDGIEKLDTSKSFQQNAETWFEFDSAAGMMIGSLIFPVREVEIPEIPEPSTRNTSISLELNFEEEIGSGVTQELLDAPVQPFDFLSYTEEDLLDWDAAIITPPPRPSGTIRVKLKYKGRSKPLPVETFWEE